MEVEIHVILILAPDGNECSASHADCFKHGVRAPRQPICRWLGGPSGHWTIWRRENFLAYDRIRTPDSLAQWWANFFRSGPKKREKNFGGS